MDNVMILMFIFSGAILVYALLLAWTKDAGLIVRNHAAKMKNRKLYAVQCAKILALTAVAPALSGLTGYLTESVLCLVAVFIISLTICIWIGVKHFMKEAE